MNQPLHQYLRAHVAAMPDKPDNPAIIGYGRESTYGELNRLIDGCAALLASMGVRQGDRVALFMQNCLQYIVAHFEISWERSSVRAARCSRRANLLTSWQTCSRAS